MNMSAIKNTIHDSYDLDDSDYLDESDYNAYVDECEAKRQAEIARREAALWLSQTDIDVPFWTTLRPAHSQVCFLVF